MKKITAILLVVALVAVAIAGSTMAYFTDEAGAVNVATVGNVKIEQIEQERDANGNLQPFTQNKPLFPYVGEIAWNDAKININGHDYSMFGEKLKNSLDKIVTVKNTGKSDAYVRTWIALEDPFTVGLLGVNVGGVGYTQTPWTTVKIKDVQYSVTCFTYNEALKPGESSLPSLLQVYLKNIATNEDAALLGDTYEILAFSQAVQTAGFADAKTALDTAFGTTHPWTAATQGNASNDAEFESALKNPNATTIIVDLTEDVTYDVAAWANDAMGGEKTELIVINGNGHTLTFHQTNSDWNNIVTNGAKLVINNAHITNSGKNDGPWNRHDLNFACEVELNNVTSDKALAFKSGATLNHVAINDANTSDTYAIWIQPNGQTVTLNNVLIDMVACSDGRGIKIDEQYVSDPKHVTLNVSNTTFKTEEKSAILVKSAAGATINLDNVDITGVAADPFYPVWVDEASTAYAHLVVVNGGDMTLERDIVVNSSSVAAGTTVSAGSVITGNSVVNNEGTIDLSGTPSLSGGDAVINGGTVLTNSANYTGLQHAGFVTYNGVTFEGSTFLYGDKVVFNNCTFNLSSNYLWTYGAAEVVFNNCTFNTDGKAILVYNEGACASKVTIKDCTFNATQSGFTSAGDKCAAVEIDSSLMPGNPVIVFEGVNNVDDDFAGLYRVKNGAATIEQ